MKKIWILLLIICLTANNVLASEGRVTVLELDESITIELPDLTRVSGRVVAISPKDAPGETYYYTVIGGMVKNNGDGSGYFALFVPCGSLFRGSKVIELDLKFGSTDQSWTVVYLWTDRLPARGKVSRTELAEQMVSLWWLENPQ